MTDTDVVLVLTTFPATGDAPGFVRALLDRRLVACGSLLPAMRSLYEWEGAVADESETLVLLKTTAAVVPAIEAALPALHPYAVPELLVFPAATGLGAYLGWVRNAVSGVDRHGADRGSDGDG
jgi:periplasmic divalent cation tolerance protein